MWSWLVWNNMPFSLCGRRRGSFPVAAARAPPGAAQAPRDVAGLFVITHLDTYSNSFFFLFYIYKIWTVVAEQKTYMYLMRLLSQKRQKTNKKKHNCLHLKKQSNWSLITYIIRLNPHYIQRVLWYNVENVLNAQINLKLKFIFLRTCGWM